MNWIDHLEDDWKKAAKDARRKKPRPPVHEVVVTSARPRSRQAAIGYYTVEGDILAMVDENGDQLKGSRPVKLDDPPMERSVAASLTKRSRRGPAISTSRLILYR